MRLLYTVIILAFVSCTNSEAVKAPQTAQDRLQMFLNRYDNAEQAAPNTMAKEALRKGFIDSVHHYLVDTLNLKMPDYTVTLKKVELREAGLGKEFIAEFEDAGKNSYWSSFMFESDSSMQKHPSYKLLKDMPEHATNTITFVYAGDIAWKYSVGHEARIRVIPLPKGYNIDSSIQANKVKAAL